MAVATRERRPRNTLAGITRRDIEKAPKEEAAKKHHQADYEQETIIIFNKADAEATVYTHEKTWQQHLEKKLKLTPVDDNKCGGKTYKIDKKRIRLPQPKKQMSAEHKAKLSARLARTRQNMPARKP